VANSEGGGKLSPHLGPKKEREDRKKKRKKGNEERHRM